MNYDYDNDNINNNDNKSNGNHGCIEAKMPGTSEPSFKPDGNLSPTGKWPTASFTVAKTLIPDDKPDLVSL